MAIMLAEDIQRKINAQPMTSLQVMVVTLCFFINAFDGFDVLAIAFTAPTISAEWNISPEQLGIVFGAGLAGMMMGSIFLAPVADYIGRRLAIIIFLSVVTLGLLLTAFTTQVSELILTRLVTGLGIGGLLPSLNTFVSEYSSEKRRNLNINIYLLGYNCGIMVGGVLSIYLITQFGWHSVYLVGAAASALLTLAFIFLMPESIDFLLLKHPKNALKKLNKILVRMNYEELDRLPPKLKQHTDSKVSIQILFSKKYIGSTLALWCCFFIAIMTVYFILNWLPTILTTTGLSNSEGISANMFFAFGGIAGMLIFGYYSSRFGLVKLIKIFFLFCSGMIFFLAFSGENLTAILIAATAIGFFVNGCVGGLYVVAARLYPPEVRTIGAGWAIGIGRLGSILSPILVGYLYGMDWSNIAVYCLFAFPPLLAIIPMYWIKLSNAAPVANHN